VKLSVIIPVYNESQQITKTIQTLRATLDILYKDDYELIIVNDGSIDDTEQFIVGVKKGVFFKNQGKGLALKAGVLLSDPLSEYLAFVDGDLQIHPKEISTFVNLMGIYNADVVIGNKRHQWSKVEYTFRRRIVSDVYNWLVRQMFGFDFRDTQCGLKLFTRQALLKSIEKTLNKGFGFDLELLVSLREQGFRVIDAPVTVSKQLNSGSVSVVNIFKTWLETWKTWRRKKHGYYNKCDNSLPEQGRSPFLPR
jgi:glycosyltransferase involved in cell wall biosynthesis